MPQVDSSALRPHGQFTPPSPAQARGKDNRLYSRIVRNMPSVQKIGVAIDHIFLQLHVFKVESKIEIRRFLNHIKARLNDIDDKICDVVSSVISPTESVQHHQKLSNERYKKGLVRKIVATEGREDLCRRTEFIIPPGKSAHFWKLFLGEAKALVADLKTRNSKNQTLSAEEFWKQLKELPQPKKDKTLAALREIVEKRPCS